MLKPWLRYLFLIYCPFVTGNAAADLFTGEFTAKLEGEVYHLSISGHARGQYDGIYRVGGESMPLNARRFGDRIAGQIGIADLKFGFMAQIQDGGLLLHDEKGRMVMFRRNLRSRSGND